MDLSLFCFDAVIYDPLKVIIVRSMRNTFEFDQPYKQAESKMQVTGKISSNK